MTIKLFSLFISVAVIYSCNNDNAVQQKNQPSNDTKATVTLNETQFEENDCVFDTSTYKFTTAVLKKYRNNIKFVWDSKENSATTQFDNGDTLTLSIGGCNHFGYSATLYSSIHFDSTKALIKKAHWLAKTFFNNGFDTKYDECIKKEQYEPSYHTINIKSFNIIDQDTSETNMVYEGFTFFRAGNRTKIVISGYIN